MWKTFTRSSSFRYHARASLLRTIDAARRESHIPQNRQHSDQPPSVKQPVDQITKEAEIPQVPLCWDDRLPDVRTIEVKEKGRSGRWKSVKVVLTEHRDKNHRQRRVWFTFSGGLPTTDELTLKWPKEKMAILYRTLRDDEEAQYSWDGTPKDFKVREKTDSNGRSFWREVIKAGEMNDEEESRSWDEWMEEEGFFAEIDRLMKKD